MAHPAKTLILNVDDDPAGLYAKSRVLRRAGFEMIEAGNGEDALRLVRERAPSLVLLDVKLPDISGLEVCRRIKSDPTTRLLPVLHITATYMSDEVRNESAESGADIYLVAPIEPAELVTVVRTLLRLRTTEVGLAESEARLRLAIEGAQIATWDMDLRDRSAVWSPLMFQMLGYVSNGSASWDMWLARIHPDDRAGVTAALEAAKRDRELFQCEHRVAPTAAQGERWLASRGNVHADEQGNPARILGVTWDISSRKAVERERERQFRLEHAARAAAEDAARLKDQFLATLSHELRTPMSAVLGWLHLLRSGRLDPAQREQALETIERNARLQNHLINDILDVSRIITGQLRLEREEVTLPPVLEAAIDAVRPAASQKGVVVDCERPVPAVTLHADAARLQQVFTNVLGNAIKFSPDGGTIAVTFALQPEVIEIAVTDRGEGIAPELLPHIFERFRQADGSITRKHGGLGLGLAIVRHLLDLHGGSIVAESAGPGTGATFVLRLPYTAALPVSAPGASDGVPHGTEARSFLPGVSALVVDDDAGAASMLAHMLRLEGARVQIASSFEQATGLFGADPAIDVVFSDIGMPGRDGYDLVSTLKREHGEGFVAIAVSGYARSEDRVRAAEAGFDLHVAKPFDMQELARSVSALLAERDRDGDPRRNA